VPDSDGRRSGESAIDASESDKCGTQQVQESSSQYALKFGEKDDEQGSRVAVPQAYNAESSNSGEGC
jgi:hypothetical protein